MRSHALLDERGVPTGATEPAESERRRFRADFDISTRPRRLIAARFSVEGAGRRLTVEYGEGYPVGQVYAPAGEAFICFEPMTAPTNALVAGERLRAVQPGKLFSATFSISIERLAAPRP